MRFCLLSSPSIQFLSKYNLLSISATKADLSINFTTHLLKLI